MERTLGRYRIVGELGRGAMGAVYRAVDPLIGREVAIKTLLPELPEDVLAEVRERFLREARSAGRLNHPNIVTIHDVGEHEGVAYIAMELLEGRSLQDILREGKRLPYATSADLAAQVADALDHAQRFAIVHRDIKPANIMVDAHGRAKLTDFGVAHLADSSMTQTGATLGSPKYMSPEQVLGQPADPRADLFSLGVVLYEMLTGRNPFQQPNDTAFSLMHRIAGEPHLPLSKANPEAPAGFERIVERALAKKPESRYQRAAEMASDLRNYRGVAGDEHARTVALRPGPAAPAAKPPAAAMHSDLLGDLDKFSADFDQQEKERLRAEQEAQRLKDEKELRRRQAFEAQLAAASGQGGGAAQPEGAGRRAMLDLIKQQARTEPVKSDPAAERSRAIDALHRALREADRYLSEIAGEINSVHPATKGPYDLPFIGRVASVTLREGGVHAEPTRFEGREVCKFVKLVYRAAPVEAHTARLQGDDIGRCIKHLKSLNIEHKALAEQRNDFGVPVRAQIAVTGAFPCEIVLTGDYRNLAVAVEIDGVRRVGRFTGTIEAAKLAAAIDELVRYILGADNAFEARLRRG